jgi:hypothetical protein
MNCDDNSKSIILPDEESARVFAIPKNYSSTVDVSGHPKASEQKLPNLVKS